MCRNHDQIGACPYLFGSAVWCLVDSISPNQSTLFLAFPYTWLPFEGQNKAWLWFYWQAHAMTWHPFDVWNSIDPCQGRSSGKMAAFSVCRSSLLATLTRRFPEFPIKPWLDPQEIDSSCKCARVPSLCVIVDLSLVRDLGRPCSSVKRVAIGLFARASLLTSRSGSSKQCPVDMHLPFDSKKPCLGTSHGSHRRF